MSLYLVTGGAGFIGSHLCDALIARGDSVRVLDDLSTGRLANLPSGLEMPGLEIIEGDIAEPATARRASEGVDGCFHLAAIASVERGVKDWLGTHRVNLTGTITIFEAIRQHATKVPVVYASSAAVYGDCETIPIHEAAERHPLSAYGADKYGCELHAITATHVHGIPTVGVRFFNIYGPRQDPKSPYSGVISIFCERILTGAPVNLFGDGAQTRDFVHVSDAVAALVAGMRRAQSGEQAGGQGQERGQGAGAAVFNVCTGQATSVLELAELIGELAGKPPDVRRMPPRSGEIRHSLGDPSNMRRGLGLDRMVTLREGLATVLAHLDARRPDA